MAAEEFGERLDNSGGGSASPSTTAEGFDERLDNGGDVSELFEDGEAVVERPSRERLSKQTSV